MPFMTSDRDRQRATVAVALRIGYHMRIPTITETGLKHILTVTMHALEQAGADFGPLFRDPAVLDSILNEAVQDGAIERFLGTDMMALKSGFPAFARISGEKVERTELFLIEHAAQRAVSALNKHPRMPDRAIEELRNEKNKLVHAITAAK